MIRPPPPPIPQCWPGAPTPPGFAGPVVHRSSLCASVTLSAGAAPAGTVVFTPQVRGGALPYAWAAENHDDNTPGGPAFAVDAATGVVTVNTSSLALTCGCLPLYDGVRYGDLHITVTDAAGVPAAQTIALAVEVTGCAQAGCPTPARTREW